LKKVIFLIYFLLNLNNFGIKREWNVFKTLHSHLGVKRLGVNRLGVNRLNSEMSVYHPRYNLKL
jgi:hypothetical protein